MILGDPNQKMRTHYNTWKWQQELKVLEKEYTGLKKNLFCISETFAISEKPPTPRIEDDEDEVEAQIMSYYSDTLNTDEMDEMMAVQEIENHMKKVKEEEEAMKGKEVPIGNNESNTQQQQLPLTAEEEISEEERRLIEASAHDEDFRIRPGMPNPFLVPPVINPVFDQPPNYVPNSNFFSSVPDPFGIKSSFNGPDAFNGQVDVSQEKPFIDPFGQPTSGLTALDVSNMVRQIRNGTMPEPNAVTNVPQPAPVHLPPVKPEFRDPRLNRSKDPRTQPSPSAPLPQISRSFDASQAVQAEEKAISKPFIKLCNPNLLVEYKMVLIKVSTINYSCYHDLYLNDFSAKNDPRLKKYFSEPKPAQNDINSFAAPPVKSVLHDNFKTISSMHMDMKVNSLPPNSQPSQISQQVEQLSTIKSEQPSPLSRDPRIRSREEESQPKLDLPPTEDPSSGNKSPEMVIESSPTTPPESTLGEEEKRSPKNIEHEAISTPELTNGHQVDDNSKEEEEMEIDLQHHESEADSENENELIIASSSETEDNRDCDSQCNNNGPVSVTDC